MEPIRERRAAHKRFAAGRRRVTLVASPAYVGPEGDMIQIDMEVPDRPGELAKLAAILGDAGINIDAIGAESTGGRSYVSLIVNQPMQARGGVMKNGYTSSMPAVLLGRLHDKPRALPAPRPQNRD